MKRPSSIRGFTLIEIVLAMLAGAIILVAIYGIFSKAIHLRDSATARVQAARLRSRAALTIRNDLANAFISGGTIALSLTGSAEAHESTFPGYLKFTTTTAKDPVLGEVGGDVQEVQYFVVTDPAAGSSNAGLLVRTANRVLLAASQTEPTPVPLLSGVASLEVLFYDGQSWLSTWQVTDTNDDLPEAIHVIVHPAAAADGTTPPPIDIYVPWTTQPQIGTTDVPATPAASPATSS